nr:hypothetical protein [Catenulispora acidiphila]
MAGLRAPLLSAVVDHDSTLSAALGPRTSEPAAPVAPARHLQRAKDLGDSGYADLAAAASLSRAHFSREFWRAFGESEEMYGRDSSFRDPSGNHIRLMTPREMS